MVEARAVIDGAADSRVGEREAMLRRHNQLLLRLAKSEAIDDGDLARAFPLLTELAVEGFQLERASIWLYTADRGAIECVDLYQRSRGEHLRGGRLQARDFPGYFAALAEARTIAATDAHTHPAPGTRAKRRTRPGERGSARRHSHRAILSPIAAAIFPSQFGQ